MPSRTRGPGLASAKMNPEIHFLFPWTGLAWLAMQPTQWTVPSVREGRLLTRSIRLLVSILTAVVTFGLAAPAGALSAPTAAQIRLTPTVAPPTSRVQVSGRGFRASETVDISFDTTLVAQATTDPLGNFAASFAVPASALPGSHAVEATGQSSGLTAQATFLVRTDWSAFRFGASRTGFNPYENVLNSSNVSGLVLGWRTLLPSFIDCSPTVAGGVVYIADDGGDLDALDATTGAILWAVPNVGICPGSPDVVRGLVYTAFGSTVYAHSATNGTVLWSTAIGGGTSSSPIVSGGLLFLGAEDHNVYALDAQTGSVV